MQPCEAAVPMLDGAGVPCMPMPGLFRPIQRVPSGLPGPGGTGPIPAAHAESGGFQVGFFALVMIRKLPMGVGWAAMPTATR